MKQRLITAIIMTIVFIPFILLGGWHFAIFASVLSLIGMYELIKMYEVSSKIPKTCKFVLPLFSILIVIIGYAFERSNAIYVLLLEYIIFMILPLFSKKISYKNVAFFMLSIIYTGVSFLMIARIRNIDAIKGIGACITIFRNYDIMFSGLALFVYVIMICALTDIGAYQFGTWFGKHKLCSKISPKKTVEGAVCGLLCGTLFGTLFMLVLRLIFAENYISFSIFEIENYFLYIISYIGLSLIISLCSMIGDLVASKIKREFGIKDFGTIFPGHGGVLDRFDSSIFTFIVFYIVLMIIGVM